MKRVEYRVRPVTRYIVTRFESADRACGSESLGEFDNESGALRAMEAFAGHEVRAVGAGIPLNSDGKSISWDEPAIEGAGLG